MISADAFVQNIQQWHSKINALKTVEALKKNEFNAAFFETRAEVLQIISSYIKPGNTVAFGGSQTIRQLNLGAVVEKSGGVLLDHNAEGLTPDEKVEVMRKQQTCDLFISSSNAISLKGELINVDGNGNRISAMIFGPRKTVIVSGINKLVANEEAAWQRIREVAAPQNLKRLQRNTPCTSLAVCADCSQPERGCRAYLVLRKKPSLADFSVFIINESLGF